MSEAWNRDLMGLYDIFDSMLDTMSLRGRGLRLNYLNHNIWTDDLGSAHIRVETPGATPEVTIKGNLLVVKTKRVEKPEAAEFVYEGIAEKTLHLNIPKGYDCNNIEALDKGNGMLEIILPRLKDTTPEGAKVIEIKSAK